MYLPTVPPIGSGMGSRNPRDSAQAPPVARAVIWVARSGTAGLRVTPTLALASASIPR
jgi:hypothetical protein